MLTDEEFAWEVYKKDCLSMQTESSVKWSHGVFVAGYRAAQHRAQLTALRLGWKARIGDWFMWLGASLSKSGGN